MALGDPRNISSVIQGFNSGLDRQLFQNLDIVRPVQTICGWLAAIDNGGLNSQDAATITNPDTEIVGSTAHIVRTNGFGTQLKVRMQYDDGITPSADPIIQCFGRGRPGDVWQLLQNKAGSTSITLVTATSTDLTDGTDLYTAVDPDDHHIDQDGCTEFLFGVTTAFAGTGGPSASVLQVAVI